MLRLILPEEKKKLKREYVARLFVMSALVLSFVCAAWGVSQLPTYALLAAETRVLRESLRIATDPALNTDRDALKAELQAVSKQLTLIDVPAYQVSRVLAHVTAAQTAAIGLSSITFDTVTNEDTKETTGMLVLTGAAATRSSLIAFRDTLAADTVLVADVALPLATLAKERDIPFVITVTLAPLVTE